MRILYGVVGEGMGHAMRSRVVLEHLVSQGHEVEIIASGRAVRFLRERGFHEVHEIHGLHIVYEDNEVRRNKTFWSNVLKGAVGLPKNVQAYFRLIEDFAPKAVISDFESWTYFYAKAHGLPVISVDNMQVINRCTHPKEILDGYRGDFEIAKALVKSKLPFCDHYLITTFFQPEIRKKNTSLHPPILRPEILAARPEEGEHILVYQTAQGHAAMLQALADTGVECRVYGVRRDLTEEQREGNLRFMPFSEDGFIEDLRTSRALIASGGFTLMGEAVYLHKPMLAVPLDRMFEQIMNSRYLDYLGYGQYAKDLDDPATVHAFLERVPDYAQALSSYSQDGNRDLLGAVDTHLDRAEAGVYKKVL